MRMLFAYVACSVLHVFLSTWVMALTAMSACAVVETACMKVSGKGPAELRSIAAYAIGIICFIMISKMIKL